MPRGSTIRGREAAAAKEPSMKKQIALAAVLAALASPALAQAPMMAPAPMAMPLTATTYRTMALVSDSFEIQSSRLAMERSRNPRVRSHARMMIEHHAMTTRMLLPAARVGAVGGTGSGALGGAGVGALVAGPVGAVVGAGVGAATGTAADATGSVATGSAPIVVAQLDARHAAMLSQLQGLQGPSFDAAYGQMQFMSHQEALALHVAYAQSGDDPTLRSFAAQTAPIVEQHLAMSTRLPGVRNR
jgi:predicted outer membrane protein